MNRFIVAIVVIILMGLCYSYKVDSDNNYREVCSLSDSVLVLNTEISLITQKQNDKDHINLILRNNIKDDSKLKKDSIYLELSNKYN